MLAALGPKMLALASERTSGTITWMTGPKTIESFIGPAMEGEEIVAGVPVWITDDVPVGRRPPKCSRSMDGCRRIEQCSTGKAWPVLKTCCWRVTRTVRAGLAEYAAAATEVAMSVFGGPESADAVFELAAAMVKVLMPGGPARSESGFPQPLGGNEMRFAGITTFAPPGRSDPADLDVAVFGVPFDLGVEPAGCRLSRAVYARSR